MSVKYIYNNLITDIEDRENTVEDIQKVQSTTYKDSELYSVDFQVFKKIQDAVDYGMDNLVKLTSNAIHTAEELKYTNTSTSLSNMHLNQCDSVNNLSRLVVNLGCNSEKAYELVATDFSENMRTVSTNISESYEWAEIVRKDCDNVDNFNAETDPEHTLQHYEGLLSAHVETARDFLGKADDALEAVEEILNKRGFKKAGEGDFLLSLSTTIGDTSFDVFGENAETVRSIFNKTGIDPTSEEGQALWEEIDALIHSDPENSSTILENLANSIPDTYIYWDNQSNWDSPANDQYIIDGCSPSAQYYEVDGMRFLITRYEIDDSTTPMLDGLMNKTIAYTSLDSASSYPEYYKGLISEGLPLVRVDITPPPKDWNREETHYYNPFGGRGFQISGGKNTFSNSSNLDYSLNRCFDESIAHGLVHRFEFLPSPLTVGMKNMDDLYEKIPELSSLANNNAYVDMRNFLELDATNHDMLLEDIGQENYDAILQGINALAKEALISGSTYQTEIAPAVIIVNGNENGEEVSYCFGDSDDGWDYSIDENGYIVKMN